MKFDRYIGVDCGKTFGICQYKKRDIIEDLFSCTLLEFQDFVTSKQFDKSTTRFIVEDPTKIGTVFHLSGYEKQLTQSVYKVEVGNALKVLRQAAQVGKNVGQVIAITNYTIDWLVKEGYNVLAVVPRSGKWDKEFFKRVTGYEKRTNQHTRDAGKLVWGL